MKETSPTETALLTHLQTQHPHCGDVGIATDLVASGQLDSLVVLDLVCFVELQFGIRMSPRDVSPKNLRSIERLARYVEAMKQQQAA